MGWSHIPGGELRFYSNLRSHWRVEAGQGHDLFHDFSNCSSERRFEGVGLEAWRPGWEGIYARDRSVIARTRVGVVEVTKEARVES